MTVGVRVGGINTKLAASSFVSFRSHAQTFKTTENMPKEEGEVAEEDCPRTDHFNANSMVAFVLTKSTLFASYCFV